LVGGQINLGANGGGDQNQIHPAGSTGLPENDDEILRQLHEMTEEMLNEEKTANLYLL
jgi:hypothetical protein